MTAEVIGRTTSLRRDGIEKIVPAQVEFTPRLLAEVFADMSDEAQAQFFIDLAEIAATWRLDPHPQWFLIGRHLRTCSCATEASRDVVDGIHRGMVGHG